jgi:hypothetical protein
MLSDTDFGKDSGGTLYNQVLVYSGDIGQEDSSSKPAQAK